MPKLLLHTCCAPCAVGVNGWLAENGFQVTGYFYNPNIRPPEEYDRRRQTLVDYARQIDWPVHFEPNDRELAPKDCAGCYEARLAKTAQAAKSLACDHFSTTLLISPYQDHELLKELGRRIGARYAVDFYYRDFRIYFQAGQQRSRELKLYRQKYCGCTPCPN